MNIKKILCCCFVFVYISSANAQVINEIIFNAQIDSLMKVWNIPGCSIAIVKDSTVLFSKGYGYADFENKIKANSNTIYGIASCTKAITCFALGLLNQQNKMDWFTPVNNYYHEFILSDPYITANITPLDLVTHRSGYPANDMLWYNSGKTRKELISLVKYLKPSKSFRSYFQYNNLMYIAAGELVEKISGTTWENFIQENIFTPLEMTNSSFLIKDVIQNENNSSRYLLKDNKPIKIEMLDADNIGGAGSINSTVLDMSNWLIMNINNGKFKGKQIISEAEIQFLHKPVMTVHSPIAYPELFYSSYALGWYVSCYKGNKILRHAGALDGVSTLTSFMPDKKLGIIIIANLDEAANFTTSVTYMIYDILNRYDLTDWSNRFLNEKIKANDLTNKEIIDKKPTTHKLISYLGDYYNLPYGKVTITEKNENLYLNYNKFTIPLKHITYNNFEANESYVFGNMIINFEIDKEGNIYKLNIPFESKTDDIEFIKKY
ncbi:MAG TPA: serine hydrolase [Melioribacteraceae bacterium]|nr:serine hydrolase [Melioribacteraceae bacterium]